MLNSILVALGVGLLIGLERERRKGDGPDREPAGIRSFAIAALLGVTTALTGEILLVAIAALGLASFVVVSYARSASDDPGLTTEIALLITFAIGVLAASEVQIAAILGVLVAVLLVSRSWLHAFARTRLSERELQDGIMLAAAAIVVLPLLPDRPLDPWGAINPQLVWRLTIIVMVINALGYVALRFVGLRWGLPLTGLLGGFASSTAVIAAMGHRSRSDQAMLRPAVAAAAMSSIATCVQLLIVVAAANAAALAVVAPPVLAMAGVAIAAGLWFAHHAVRDGDPPPQLAGRAFQLRLALGFAALLAILLWAVALLNEVFGARGAFAAAVVGGFADAHSSAASVASLGARGAIDLAEVALGVGFGASANTVSKLVVARVSGGWAYFARLAPSLLLMLVAYWGVWFVVLR